MQGPIHSKTMSQFAQIRGFNYTPSTAYHTIDFWRDYEDSEVVRDLGYAQRLGLNSARIFLSHAVWAEEPDNFIRRLRHFVRTADNLGISTMPIFWDSCFDESEPDFHRRGGNWIPSPGVHHLGESFWTEGERFCRAVLDGLAGESGVLMWDVMNEPRVTTWLKHSDEFARTEKIWTFVRHFCQYLKSLEHERPITVGVHASTELPNVLDHVDVASFHNYRGTAKAIADDNALGVALAAAQGKPAIVSEIGCVARSNPYDVAISICHEQGIGWYLWELMIGVSQWNDIHGIVYSDGTVRDPSIVAAIQGFYRNRTATNIPENVDRELVASALVDRMADWLSQQGSPAEVGLDLAEQGANLLEAAQMVPMRRPPTTTVRMLRAGSHELDPIRELLRFLHSRLAQAIEEPQPTYVPPL
jgi:hypothetical protein